MIFYRSEHNDVLSVHSRNKKWMMIFMLDSSGWKPFSNVIQAPKHNKSIEVPIEEVPSRVKHSLFVAVFEKTIKDFYKLF